MLIVQGCDSRRVGHRVGREQQAGNSRQGETVRRWGAWGGALGSEEAGFLVPQGRGLLPTGSFSPWGLSAARRLPLLGAGSTWPLLGVAPALLTAPGLAALCSQSMGGGGGGAPELQGSTETGRYNWCTQGWLRHYRVGRGPLAGEAGGRKGQPDPTAGRRGGGSQGGVGVIGLTPGPTEPGQRDTDEKSHVSQARTRGRKASSAASVAGTEPAGGRRGPTQTRQRCGCQPGPAPAPAPRGSE